MLKHFGFLYNSLTSNLTLALNKSFHMFFHEGFSNDVDDPWSFIVILVQKKSNQFLHFFTKSIR